MDEPFTTQCVQGERWAGDFVLNYKTSKQIASMLVKGFKVAIPSDAFLVSDE